MGMPASFQGILAAIAVLLASGAASAQSETLPVVISLDPTRILEEGDTSIVRALAQAVPLSEWPTVRVEQGDRLWAIVNELYGFNDRTPVMRDLIGRLVVEANALPSVHSLQAGAELSVPFLPHRPDQDAEFAGAQILELSEREMRLEVQGRDVASAEMEQFSFNRDLFGRGRGWTFEMTSSSARRLLNSLNRDEIAKLTSTAYIGPKITVLGTLEVPVEVSPRAIVREPDMGRADLSRIPLSLADTLYILDFFGKTSSGEPSHGDKVVDVVRQVLERANGGHFMRNVVPVDLSFFDHRGEALREISQYLFRFEGSARAGIASDLQYLAEMPRPANSKRIPLIYPRSIFGNRLTDSGRAVFTSSFWTNADIYGIVPPEYSMDHRQMFVSAVSNLSGQFIEDATLQQPQQAYHEQRQDKGVVLVGAQDGPSSYFGAASRLGDGITTLAPGIGWSGAAISPSDRGSSFAAPAVAAVLMAARAYWRSTNQDLPGQQIIRRLKLSSDVKLEFEGRFASAGVPRLDRLLLPSGHYAVTTDGTVAAVTIRKGSRIWVTVDDSPVMERHLWPGSVVGLAVTDSGALVYPMVTSGPRSWPERWQQVRLHSVDLHIEHLGQQLHMRTIDAFQSLFQELFIYEEPSP